MKLRNKKTGKVIEWFNNTDGIFPNTLAELNEEWEDYKEPKELWSIDQFGEPINVTRLSSLQLEKLRRIGNLFESEEKTERAVEKLKAWERLKAKGFSIYNWDYEFDMVDKPSQTIILRASAVDSSNTDLDLLFGGEE